MLEKIPATAELRFVRATSSGCVHIWLTTLGGTTQGPRNLRTVVIGEMDLRSRDCEVFRRLVGWLTPIWGADNGGVIQPNRLRGCGA